ncbi:hypothetical protein Taro_034586 [Colocasia esculenta]|uniref:Tyrosinase copper-binding domain-containing protein n=1 Tax=Colocasia esculenta TaxID=4460 RepID=A0A843VRT1_COLES|nr:hypothetical protein [Colocasia esculenta]
MAGLVSQFKASSHMPAGILPTALSSACPLHGSRKRHVRVSGKGIHVTSPARISCMGENASGPWERLDRRDLLLGMGGLYAGLAAVGGGDALASPIQAPDLSKCGAADIPAGASPTNCCPPYASDIVDYKFRPSGPLRVRPAAHLVDSEYLAKYERAVALMKALPADDPRNFTQQANVHCAYCDGAYDQVGFPDLELQVHNSWLFFPWHRFYLHFHERILGKLIGDPNFALPFWNWDAPRGMTMPPIFTNSASPLYDKLRDSRHQPPTLIDLDFGATEEPPLTSQQQIRHNLAIMYRQMVSNGKTPTLFLGRPYRAGDEPDPGAGSLENVPHGPVHVWTGDSTQPNGENMGTFYSAARDPIFYSHHSNVDRCWHLWKQLSQRHVDFRDRDWLETSFLFYDEDARLVRVKVKDCLEPEMLGYTYQDVDIPWISSRPTPTRSLAAAGKASTRQLARSVAEATFPLTLKKAATVTVRRPKVSRKKEEKEQEEEVLVVDGIEFDRHNYIKFDVYVNAPGDGAGVTPSASEFAGSFVSVPHKHRHSKKEMKLKTRLRLGITDLLEDLEAEDEQMVVVTLVPRKGKGLVKVGGVRIEFSS